MNSAYLNYTAEICPSYENSVYLYLALAFYLICNKRTFSGMAVKRNKPVDNASANRGGYAVQVKSEFLNSTCLQFSKFRGFFEHADQCLRTEFGRIFSPYTLPNIIFACLRELVPNLWIVFLNLDQVCRIFSWSNAEQTQETREYYSLVL